VVDNFQAGYTRDQLVLIGYEYADSFNAARAAYYNITAWPTIVGDGLADIWPTSLLGPCYTTLSARTSPLTIDLEENGVGDFTAHIHAEQAVTGAKFVMAAVLDEYVSAYGGGQSHLPYHCKVFMTAVTGDAFSLAAGASTDIRKTFTVNPAWDYAKMGVVCWVQQPGGTNPTSAPAIPIRNEVLQAAYIHTMSADVADLPAESRAALLPPSPNPFAGSATLAFTLPGAGHVSLDLYDASGRHVAEILDATLSGGSHEAAWDGRDAGGTPCGAGIYFARMVYEGNDAGTQKVVKLR
jgi:hypothetical protein